jgi:hypothetical protein
VVDAPVTQELKDEYWAAVDYEQGSRRSEVPVAVEGNALFNEDYLKFLISLRLT